MIAYVFSMSGIGYLSNKAKGAIKYQYTAPQMMPARTMNENNQILRFLISHFPILFFAKECQVLRGLRTFLF